MTIYSGDFFRHNIMTYAKPPFHSSKKAGNTAKVLPAVIIQHNDLP